MGTISNIEDCPRCKSRDVLHTNYKYKTGEENVFCENCGFYYSSTIVRDEDGNPALIYNNLPASLKNVKFKTVEIFEPFGSFEVNYKDNQRQIGSLETEEDYKIFKEDVFKIPEISSEVDYVFVNQYINGKIERELIYGTPLIVYKLMREMKDGISSLFINKKERYSTNKWMRANFHSTNGFAERLGWHCTSQPVAPHLKENLKDGTKRAWYKVEILGYEEVTRSENQEGLWYISKYMKILEKI